MAEYFDLEKLFGEDEYTETYECKNKRYYPVYKSKINNKYYTKTNYDILFSEYREEHLDKLEKISYQEEHQLGL